MKMAENWGNTKLHSKDNAAARRRLRRRISNTSRKPKTQPIKLAKEGNVVYLYHYKDLYIAHIRVSRARLEKISRIAEEMIRVIFFQMSLSLS